VLQCIDKLTTKLKKKIKRRGSTEEEKRMNERTSIKHVPNKKDVVSVTKKKKKKKTPSFLPASLQTQKSNKNNNNTDNYNNKNSKKKKNGNPKWSQEGLFCFCCSLVVIVF
jgi:hypothetical protein